LFRAARLLSERKEELAQQMTREMGKVLAETRGDVQEAIDMIFYMAGEGRRLFGQTTTSELPNKFAMSVRVPVGVCGLICPWNFPMAIPTWKIFPALAAGNTVVFKPATDTPYTGLKLVEVLIDAGVPAGVVNFICGPGGEVGEALAAHPEVDLISFTGSTAVGRRLAEVCGKNLKRLSLEMGGKNAELVMDDADLELALEGALWGAFGTAGQRCTATSRIILHREIARQFTTELVERARRLKLGDGLDESVQVGPVINAKQLESIHAYMAVAKADGAKILCGGAPVKAGELARGHFYAPTVLDGVRPEMRVAREEIFGPVVSLLECSSLEEGIAVLNATDYGLSSSIYTRDVNRAFQAIRDFQAGIVYVNGPTIGAEIGLPFGGVKGTGNGHRESGVTVYDTYTEWKSVYVDYSGQLQRAQIDTEKLARVKT
jgi:aldehyde dehydrogenase (NAD+)